MYLSNVSKIKRGKRQQCKNNRRLPNPLSTMDRLSRKNINRKTLELNNALGLMNPRDTETILYHRSRIYILECKQKIL